MSMPTFLCARKDRGLLVLTKVVITVIAGGNRLEHDLLFYRVQKSVRRHVAPEALA